MPKIVLAGHDLHLLESRAEVLKRTGAEVFCCTGRMALKVVTTGKPDLLVLCHTLPHEEAEAIAKRVYMCSPETKVLLVVSQVLADRPYEDAKFDSTSLPEPSRLIARTTELLRGGGHLRIA
jgi:DNA-binding response OmpR family regulator